ncbi:MAG: crossover junction endodeoxyribonuclease RuvC [Fusobacteriaceae bacterium]
MLGIDLSASCPGFAVWNDETKELIYCDNLLDKTYKKNSFWERMDVINDHVKELISEFQTGKVVIENAFMSGKTANSNMPLLMLRGSLLSVIKDLGCSVRGVMPSSARAFMKIKPNTKEEAFDFIKGKFPEANLETFKKDNDKSDAILVAMNFDNPKCEEVF